MADRKTRLSAILAKIETTQGVDAVPTGGANAMLVGDVTARAIVANSVNRDRLRTYIGGNQALVGPIYKEVSFNVELVGSGTAGTAPLWGVLARASAMAEAIIAATRVDYTPITAAQETASLYVFADGVRHILLGAKGDWTLNCRVGELPVLGFRFMGLDGGESAVTNPSIDVSGFAQPQIPQAAFTQSLVLGGTVSPAGAPAVTGGTAFSSTGIQLAAGHEVPFVPLIGGNFIDINSREITGSIVLDLTAAQEVARLAEVRANSLQGVSMIHGNVAGRRVLVHLPSGQLVDPAYEDNSGKLMQRFGLRGVPVSGNDEFRLVTSF